MRRARRTEPSVGTIARSPSACKELRNRAARRIGRRSVPPLTGFRSAQKRHPGRERPRLRPAGPPSARSGSFTSWVPRVALMARIESGFIGKAQGKLAKKSATCAHVLDVSTSQAGAGAWRLDSYQPLADGVRGSTPRSAEGMRRHLTRVLCGHIIRGRGASIPARESRTALLRHNFPGAHCARARLPSLCSALRGLDTRSALPSWALIGAPTACIYVRPLPTICVRD
jgi:hypothetical protein